MRNFAISIAAVSAATLIATADADQVDRYLEAQIRALHLSGLSIAVMRDGKLIKTQGYGFANLELKAPATKSTVYEIGSVTKQFTVAAIMLLVEESKLRLDDSVTQFFPKLPRRGVL